MMAATYQSARARMLSRIKRITKMLEDDNILVGELAVNYQMDLSEFIRCIIVATYNVQQYTKSRGFDGWYYDTEAVRGAWASGYFSKGKKFAQKIYWITAVELFINMLPRDPVSLKVDLIIRAGRDCDHPAVVDLCTIWNWKRHYQTQQQHQTRNSANDQQQSSRRNYRIGGDFQHRIVRTNEWAYKGECLEQIDTWFHVLGADENGAWNDIRSSYYKKMHIYKDNTQALQRLVAAYNVAKKVHGNYQKQELGRIDWR